jgi:hypothetical protein
MRIAAKPTGLALIAAMCIAITAGAFYGIGRFLFGLVQREQLDWVGWLIVAVASLVPFVVAYVFSNLMWASMVSFDEKGVYRRTLAGVRFIPWASVSSMTIDLKRVELQTRQGPILFFPLALDTSTYDSSMEWLAKKAEALATRDT